jgi:hypothetical protein
MCLAHVNAPIVKLGITEVLHAAHCQAHAVCYDGIKMQHVTLRG